MIYAQVETVEKKKDIDLTWLVLNIYFDPLATCPMTIIMLVREGLEWAISE